MSPGGAQEEMEEVHADLRKREDQVTFGFCECRWNKNRQSNEIESVISVISRFLMFLTKTILLLETI